MIALKNISLFNNSEWLSGFYTKNPTNMGEQKLILNEQYEFLTPSLSKAFYLHGIASERIVLHETKQETK